MPSSRKTYRIPSGQELPSDNLSIASGSSSSTLPPHLRGWSSTVSGPPYNDASGSKLPPHLRSHQPRSVSSDQNVNQKSIEKAQQPENEDPPSPQSATAAPRVAVQSNFIRDRPFACTFEGCDKIFKTKALLIKHKVADEEGHDYCRVCDLDFKDDDSFHNHKVSSEAHICCPVCSEDFKSEGGRDRHFTQVNIFTNLLLMLLTL